MNWLDSLDFEHRSRDDIQVTLCQFYDQNQLAARLGPPSFGRRTANQYKGV